MKEIFQLQWDLNTYTLANIGKDYGETITDPEQKPVWIESYRKALSAELAELIREVEEYGPGTRNAKIEIVDMLHFLVSLSHIAGIATSQIPEAFRGEGSFSSIAIRTFLALDDLQNALKWKWWAKGGGYKEDKAREAVLELWKCFWELCGLADMNQETVKKIYVAKNEVNFKRQDRHYNEDTKTEADNLALGNVIDGR